MSVRIMSAIFESSTLAPTERLIMLSLADHADDEGRCYPSVQRLCQRTGLSERAIQTNIRKLTDRGYIRSVTGGGRNGTNVYFVSANPAGDVLVRNEAAGRAPTAKLRFAIYRRDQNTCVYCGFVSPDGEQNLTLDHIVPKSKGGTHDEANLVTCCQDCNRSKKDKLVDVWLALKPRSKCTPQYMHPAGDAENPAPAAVNPAGHAPKPSVTIKNRQQSRATEAAAASQQDLTDRERLLAAMGVGPDGITGPSGFIGRQVDMAEAAKWSELGLTLDDQCRQIAEVCERQRSRQPGWMPRGFGYFSQPMADLAARRKTPMPSASVQPMNDERSRRKAFYRRVAGADAPSSRRAGGDT